MNHIMAPYNLVHSCNTVAVVYEPWRYLHMPLILDAGMQWGFSVRYRMNLTEQYCAILLVLCWITEVFFFGSIACGGEYLST